MNLVQPNTTVDFSSILSNANINPNPNSNPNIINNLYSNIINENYSLAIENIPELINLGNLIFLNGKISGHNIKILVDTGAQMCIINKSVIDCSGLNYLIDTKNQINISGAHSTSASVGTLWYVEIEIELSDGNYASLPISAHIIDDSMHIEQQKQVLKQINELREEYSNLKFIIDNFADLANSNNIDMIYFEKIKESIRSYDEEIKNNNAVDIILGSNFLKSYKANINYSKSIITLNDVIDIQFK